jgi:TolA-binding protein
MKFKTLMLGTAAFAVMVAPALAATTSTTSTTTTTTTTKHHHHHAVMASSEPSSVDARIDQLENEIHELKAEQAANQAAPAASDEQVSEAQFESLQNQVYEQAAATRSGWWSNTKISGRFYWDVSSVSATGNIKSVSTGGVVTTADHTKSPQNGFNYDLKRAYLMIDHKFNDTYSANLTTDATYDGTTKASQIFVKKAYLQAAYSPMFTVRVGAADLPWVPFVEGIYGYRYVENTLIDRTKFGTSADWGAHILGTFDLGGPTLGYQLSAVNGLGYKADPIGGGINRTKGVDFEGRINLNWDGFVAAVGGYRGKLGNDLQNSTGATCSATTVGATCHTAERFDALLAYTDDALRVGAEYFSATNYKNVTNSATSGANIYGVTRYGDDKASGYSAFASYRFDPMWSVFGRYDWVDPTKVQISSSTGNHGAGKQTNQYYNFGLSYSPIPQLDFALVYKHDSFRDGFAGDSEFTSGAASSGSGSNGFVCYTPTGGGHLTAVGNCNQGTYNEIGLFGQVNF